tara:strand:- start:1592 stop:2719 length:1128 start_codon:yes stop_codon:yes gene_type:complete
MFKYLKYFFPVFVAFLAMIFYLQGPNYPIFFLFLYSVIIIAGDFLVNPDSKIQKFSYPEILNFSMYLNLPIMFIMIFFVISIFSSINPLWYIDFFKNFLNIDFIELKNSYSILDKIAIVIHISLLVGSMGITAGHELTHRKKNKFDMFVGNWLLSFSWDCNFAIEHVYGHHKNVCLDEDPASAKRGQNIYGFIIKAIIDEHKSGWDIELKRLTRKNNNVISFKNKMIIGYLRSIILSFFAFIFGGIFGLLTFLLIAFISKTFLEAINFIEHYGLIRERDKPVKMRHSWNSNHFFSSIFLYNVTRHSHHHKNSNLKFWELEPINENAPMLPYGYLTMLYLVLFLPFIYNKIMKKELVNWDENFASKMELILLKKSF